MDVDATNQQYDGGGEGSHPDNHYKDRGQRPEVLKRGRGPASLSQTASWAQRAGTLYDTAEDRPDRMYAPAEPLPPQTDGGRPSQPRKVQQQKDLPELGGRGAAGAGTGGAALGFEARRRRLAQRFAAAGMPLVGQIPESLFEDELEAMCDASDAAKAENGGGSPEGQWQQ